MGPTLLTSLTVLKCNWGTGPSHTTKKPYHPPITFSAPMGMHKSNCHGVHKYFSAHGEGLTLFTLKAHLQYRILYSNLQSHVLFLVHQTKFNHSH